MFLLDVLSEAQLSTPDENKQVCFYLQASKTDNLNEETSSFAGIDDSHDSALAQEKRKKFFFYKKRTRNMERGSMSRNSVIN